jgi:hypothetical protein
MVSHGVATRKPAKDAMLMISEMTSRRPSWGRREPPRLADWRSRTWPWRLSLAPTDAPRSRVKARLMTALRSVLEETLEIALWSPTDSHNFANLERERPDALLVEPNSINLQHRKRIADFLLGQKLPAMYGERRYMDRGLISYGPNLSEHFRPIRCMRSAC